jgi:hypothetical protein
VDGWTTSTVAARHNHLLALIRTRPTSATCAAVEAVIKQAIDVFKIADDARAGRAYMGGSEFSMGDIRSAASSTAG